jgi:cell division initiation protein
MRITPLDVRKQEFRRVMRGLDADEVYAFLATVADEYEAVLNDTKALRERVLELDDKVQEFRSIERTLRDTLLTAERVTVESKDNARREANLIVKEAQLEAEKSLRNITSEASRLRQEIQRLRSQRDAYLAKMKVVAESHVKFIDAAERELHSEDDSTPETARPETPASPKAKPSNLFEKPASAPAPKAAPKAEAPRPRPAAPRPAADPNKPVALEKETEAIDGLGDILDRLSQSQRDMRNESAPSAAPPQPTPSPVRDEETASDDGGSEWHIEQIRRDLQRLASTTRPPEGPNT